MNAKKISPTPCACKLKCCSRITTVQRNTYLITSDFNAQNAYLCGCIKVIDPKRRYQTSPNSSRHQYSRVFYKNRQGVSVRVCKKLFLRTFAISNGRMDRALRAQLNEGGSLHMDQRGKHTPANKTRRCDINRVKEHVETFQNIVHIIPVMTIRTGVIFLQNFL